MTEGIQRPGVQWPQAALYRTVPHCTALYRTVPYKREAAADCGLTLAKYIHCTMHHCTNNYFYGDHGQSKQCSLSKHFTQKSRLSSAPPTLVRLNTERPSTK